MVGIVAVTKFTEADSIKFSSYINYIDRDNATRLDNIEKFNMFSGYMEYMDDDEKKAEGNDIKDISKQEDNTENISSLFTTEKDSLNVEDKTKLKESFEIAQSNGSNMWQTVISFDNKYLQEIGIYDYKTGSLNEKQLIQAGRKAVNNMLRNEDLEHAIWTGAIHYNTDNIHIHIAITEVQPMRKTKEYIIYEKNEDGEFKTMIDKSGSRVKIPVLNKDGKPKTYTGYVGRFKDSSHKILKSSIIKELDMNKEGYIEINSLLRGIIEHKKENLLMENQKFADKMSEIYRLLKTSTIKYKKKEKEIPLPRRYWNYNQNSIAHIKPKIDDLSNLFIKTYHREDYEKLLAELKSEAEIQKVTYGGGSDYVNNKLYGKDGLYARLGNAILKEIRAYDKDKQNAFTMYHLGKQLIYRENEDTSKAVEYLEESSKKGNIFAKYQLGRIYTNPEFKENDINKGIELLKDAAKDLPQAYNDLGHIYLRGHVVKKDQVKAKESFIASARAGNEHGKRMILYIKNGYTNEFFDYKYEMERAIRKLKNSLNQEYSHYINMREAEELQYEIDNRGVEL